MFKYQLFNEWRGISLYGENLTDALTRQKTLQRSDKYEQGFKVEEGEVLPIKRVIGIKASDNSRRGDKKTETAVVEFDDGRIMEVDAYPWTVEFK